MTDQPRPGLGFVFTVDLELGPDGSLRGMRTGCGSIGIKMDEATLRRIGVKFQRVVESEVFHQEMLDVRRKLAGKG